MIRIHRLTPVEWLKAAGAGAATAVLLSIVLVAATKSGLSPLPQPLGLAFAETILKTDLPLPVGLVFHLAYVTFWATVFVVLFRNRLSLRNAALLGLVLWIGVLVVFFPIVGWGFFGLAVDPKLIVASLVSHALFAVFLWGFCRLAFGLGRQRTVDGSVSREIP